MSDGDVLAIFYDDSNPLMDSACAFHMLSINEAVSKDIMVMENNAPCKVAESDLSYWMGHSKHLIKLDMFQI